ncbi:DUF937 domain-containing protein [Qipengyuania sp. YIM B01966]|uniref:DUF937 domain-containing protein n=1 Tax=Qipengyuania sp. YIM B01966 TaxID=2778646 RepID=UPI0018F6F0D0|nr:DUF937 domain-containing protein [Qipengyuania sp. YIM B01966]
MSLAQILQQTGAIDSMARELNVDPQTARTAAGALLPAIVAGMGRQASGGAMGGAAAGGDPLGGLIGGLGGGGLLDSVLGTTLTPTQPGNDILGQIFGSKDVSRGVADEVAGSTGLDPSLLRKMLPILAMAAAGYLATRSQGAGAAQGQDGGLGGGLGGALGGALGGGANNPLGGILGSIVSGMARR